jgi:hypothetical protein
MRLCFVAQREEFGQRTGQILSRSVHTHYHLTKGVLRIVATQSQTPALTSTLVKHKLVSLNIYLIKNYVNFYATERI